MKTKVNKSVLVLLIVVLCLSGCNNTRVMPLFGHRDVDNGQVFIDLGDEKVAVTYSHTENHEEGSAEQSADSYGTYDVYVDDKGVEYLYLSRTEILCGMHGEKYGQLMGSEERISEEEALSVAMSMFKKYSSDVSSFELKSCQYMKQMGYYDIQYSKVVEGYATDDIMRFWVTSQGEISMFSRYKYGRYDHLTVDFEDISRAEKELEKDVIKTVGKYDYTVRTKYLSKDDSGRPILVYDVVYSRPAGNGVYTPMVELFSVVVTESND